MVLTAGGGVSISGTVLDGFGYAGVRLDPGPSPIAGAVVVGNLSRNSGPGLRCDDPTLWSAGSLTVGLNNWSVPQACSPAGP